MNAAPHAAVHSESHAPAPGAVPLSSIRAGQDVVLVSISGGRALQHRLTEMGLVRGSRFRVIANAHPGPFIVSVMETRLALGHGVVHRILVRPAE